MLQDSILDIDRNVCSNSVENLGCVCVMDSDQEVSKSMSKFEKCVVSIGCSESLVVNKSTDAYVVIHKIFESTGKSVISIKKKTLFQFHIPLDP